MKPGTSTLPTLPPVKSDRFARLVRARRSCYVRFVGRQRYLVEAGENDIFGGLRQMGCCCTKGKIGSCPGLSVGELEEGRWSRMNSRAASMILAALDESIRSRACFENDGFGGINNLPLTHPLSTWR